MSLPQLFRRRLGLAGALLLACSVIVPLLLALVVVDGADAQPETHVAGDGAAQTVGVVAGRSMMLWLDNSVTPPECSVTREDGERVTLSDVTDGPTQSAGTAGDWVGTFTFEASGEFVRVTCDGPGRPATGVLLTPAPRLVAGLSGAAVVGCVALLLLLAGLACLARASAQSRPLSV